MPRRPKGSQNKVTTEVKEQLKNLIDEVVNRIDEDHITMTMGLRLKLFSSFFFTEFLSQNNLEIEKIVNDEYHNANYKHCFIFHFHLFLNPFFFALELWQTQEL